MSKSQAIAAVTSMLAHNIAVTTGADVRLGRPTNGNGNEPPSRRVQVFLYQVTPNAACRNLDLPTRDAAGGRVVQRPQLALDLHYLLSFYGDDEALEPQLMMGAVMRDLHARSLLTRQTITTIIADISDLTRRVIIQDSQLEQAVELVKFTPTTMSLDELSKLWSVFTQTPYALSVAYLATVVLIEGEETPQPALPVLQRGRDDQGVETVLPPFPVIEEVYFGLPADKDRAPRPPSYPAAQLDSVLIIKGQNLGGGAVRLRFRHQQLPLEREEVVAAADVSNEEIKLVIPSNAATASTDWAAGIYSVKAVIKRANSDREYLSNELPLAFSPAVTAIAPANPVPRDPQGDVTLTITCNPQVLPAQSAALYLADREVIAEAHPAATDTLTFIIEDAPAVADAVLRLRVDGVDSLPFERRQNPERLVFADNQKVTIQ